MILFTLAAVAALMLGLGFFIGRWVEAESWYDQFFAKEAAPFDWADGDDAA